MSIQIKVGPQDLKCVEFVVTERDHTLSYLVVGGTWYREREHTFGQTVGLDEIPEETIHVKLREAYEQYTNTQ